MHSKYSLYFLCSLVLSAAVWANDLRKEIGAPLRKGKKGLVTENLAPVARMTRGKNEKEIGRETDPNSRDKKNKNAAQAMSLMERKLTTLHPKTRVKMQAALDDMQAAGLCPMVTSAYRSTAQQRAMYHCSHQHQCKVRRGIFSARKPGTSLHEAGLAVDFAEVAVGKKSRRYLTRDGKKIVKIMQQHGFNWRYGLKDPAHFELDPKAAGYRSEKLAIAAAQRRELQELQAKRQAARKKTMPAATAKNVRLNPHGR